MNLGELEKIIDKTIALNPESSEREVAIKIVIKNSLGPTPTTNLKSCHLGFDWDTNKFLLTPEHDLILRA